MLTGKEKAQLLLSMLGDRSKSVLSLLSPTHASLLTETIEEAPKASSAVLNSLMNEIMQKVTRVRETGSLVEKKEPLSSNAFAMSGGLGGGMSFGEDAESEEVVADEAEPKERLRSPDQIAALLSEQRPQLVAFVLSRVEEELREKIQSFLPLDMAQKIEAMDVAAVPLSQQVFDNLYDAVFILPEDDDVADDASFSPVESAEKEEPNRVFFF
jgi:flagellar motor switch protein FliG